MHDLEKSTVIGQDSQDSSAKLMYRRWVNWLLFDELTLLENDADLMGLLVVRLKGASLLPRFFSDIGGRHLSDVDVLVRPEQKKSFEELLRRRGFQQMPNWEWDGAKNRQSWIKNHSSGIQLSVDLHTRLYWRQPSSLDQEIERDSLGFWRLNDGTEFLHLIVNWIEQDTCVSSEKLDDLRIVYRALENRMNWDQWWAWVHSLGHGRSVRLAFGILRELHAVVQPAIPHPLDLRDRWALEIALSDFGRDPRERRWRYWILKHLTRPFTKALLYDVLWGWGKIRHMVQTKGTD